MSDMTSTTGASGAAMRESDRGARLLVRSSYASLAGHVMLIVFSTIALTTILAGPPPAWLGEEPATTVYRLGWQFSGPLYVILGALAAFLHASGRLGAGRAIGLFIVAALISLGAELLGTSTGLPFGPYEYTALLGYRILGLVPFPIPLSWFFMLYGALAICSRLVPAGDDVRTRLRWAVAAGVVLTAWDVSMDPAMSHVSKHWVWQTEGAFYGMPLLNFFGWVLTGSVVAFAMLAIVPPTRLAPALAPSRLPIVLYAVNGIMPVGMMARAGLWPGVVAGVLAMAIPVALALRAGPRPAGARREINRPRDVPAGAPAAAPARR